MSCDLKDMVVVASGSKQAVMRWSGLLRRAAITHHVATAISTMESDGNNSELWVPAAAADDARHAIRSEDRLGSGSLW